MDTQKAFTYALNVFSDKSDDIVFVVTIIVAFLSGALFTNWMRRSHEATQLMKVIQGIFGNLEHIPANLTTINTSQKDLHGKAGSISQCVDEMNKCVKHINEHLHKNVDATKLARSQHDAELLVTLSHIERRLDDLNRKPLVATTPRASNSTKYSSNATQTDEPHRPQLQKLAHSSLSVQTTQPRLPPSKKFDIAAVVTQETRPTPLRSNREVASLEATILRLKAQHESEISELEKVRDDTERKLRELNEHVSVREATAQRETREALEKQVAEREAELKGKYEARLKTVQNELDTAQALLKERRETIDKLAKEASSAIERRTQAEKDLNIASDEHAKALSAAESVKRELESKLRESDARGTQLTGELETKKKELTVQYDKFFRLLHIENELKRTIQERDGERKTVAEKTREVEELRKTVNETDNLESKMRNMEAQAADLDKQLASKDEELLHKDTELGKAIDRCSELESLLKQATSVEKDASEIRKSLEQDVSTSQDDTSTEEKQVSKNEQAVIAQTENVEGPHAVSKESKDQDITPKVTSMVPEKPVASTNLAREEPDTGTPTNNDTNGQSKTNTTPPIVPEPNNQSIAAQHMQSETANDPHADQSTSEKKPSSKLDWADEDSEDDPNSTSPEWLKKNQAEFCAKTAIFPSRASTELDNFPFSFSLPSKVSTTAHAINATKPRIGLDQASDQVQFENGVVKDSDERGGGVRSTAHAYVPAASPQSFDHVGESVHATQVAEPTQATALAADADIQLETNAQEFQDFFSSDPESDDDEGSWYIPGGVHSKSEGKERIQIPGIAAAMAGVEETETVPNPSSANTTAAMQHQPDADTTATPVPSAEKKALTFQEQFALKYGDFSDQSMLPISTSKNRGQLNSRSAGKKMIDKNGRRKNQRR